MNFLTKVELKRQLQAMGIKVVEGNYVRKSDIKRITADRYEPFYDFDYWAAFQARHFYANNTEAEKFIDILFDTINNEKMFDKVFDPLCVEVSEDFDTDKEHTEGIKRLAKNEGYFDDSRPDEEIWGIQSWDLTKIKNNFRKFCKRPVK